MADEEKEEETANPETQDETEESNPEVASPAGISPLSVGGTPQRPTNPLSRSTDSIERPGFRNPSNKRSKAQKKKRRKKK